MKKLKILFLSSEVAPFAKTGGLADVSSSLPKALRELGHEVRIMMPKYKVVNERKFVLREVIRLKDIPIAMGDDEIKINVKSAFTIDPIKIQTYFIDHRPYFHRDGLYVDAKSGKEYPDNAERFTLFAKGVLETLKILSWQPNVIHCNDWQASLVPFLLKTQYKDDPFFNKISSVLTIHNVEFQGNFPAAAYKNTNIDDSLFFSGSDLEFYEKFSFLKTGIYYSDHVTTVSEQYALELQESEEYGMGFEGIFKDVKKKFNGIVNGIDYSVWDPETDEKIPVNYTYGKVNLKKENKIELLKKFNLAYTEGVPVLGIVSRLTDQKGFDLLEEIAEDLFALDLQMVVIGMGEKKYHKMFDSLKKKYKGKLGVKFTFDEDLSHLVEAGADIFLMPSRFEPCGLNQLFSLRYGTVPVVRKVGGLADTITEFDEKTEKGNGFVFDKYSSKDFLAAIKRALKLFEDLKTWKKILKNGMKQDFSWNSSAKKYSKIYEKIIKK
ncbi:MAG: glycogen synthase GlgA [bacterium]|nr:glycogen synthase GlgA [bacterium]